MDLARLFHRLIDRKIENARHRPHFLADALSRTYEHRIHKCVGGETRLSDHVSQFGSASQTAEAGNGKGHGRSPGRGASKDANLTSDSKAFVGPSVDPNPANPIASTGPLNLAGRGKTQVGSPFLKGRGFKPRHKSCKINAALVAERCPRGST